MYLRGFYGLDDVNTTRRNYIAILIHNSSNIFELKHAVRIAIFKTVYLKIIPILKKKTGCISAGNANAFSQ